MLSRGNVQEKKGKREKERERERMGDMHEEKER